MSHHFGGCRPVRATEAVEPGESNPPWPGQKSYAHLPSTMRPREEKRIDTRSSVEGSHSSRPTVADGLKQPPESIDRTSRSLLGLASAGVCQAAPVTRNPVGSYPAFAPLPDPLAGPSAVCFLLHFPSRHRAWPLASNPSYEAPTFLSPLRASDYLIHFSRGSRNRTRVVRFGGGRPTTERYP